MKAEVIAHSVTDLSIEMVTWELECPRFIWAEMLTHGRLSKNASSSRAIPNKRLTQDILDHTAMPVFWGGNKPGMQAGEEIDAQVQDPITGEMLSREDAWKRAASYGVAWARAFHEAGYHKQLSNRLCENLGHIRAVVSGTELENFFNLRCHPDAQPEINALARMMRSSLRKSEPRLLKNEEWHLPYVTLEDRQKLVKIVLQSDKLKGATITQVAEIANGLARLVSAARCARVSYKTFHGTTSTLEEDLKLCRQLALSVPGHWSPFQHQAKPDFLIDGKWAHPEMRGNLIGMQRSRELFEANHAEMVELLESF